MPTNSEATLFTNILEKMIVEVWNTLRNNEDDPYTQSEIDYFFDQHRKEIVRCAKRMYYDYKDDPSELDNAEDDWYREYLEPIYELI